jgi:hypothetical protein
MTRLYSVFINLGGDSPDFEENAYYLTIKEAEKMASECQDDGFLTEIVDMTDYINKEEIIA